MNTSNVTSVCTLENSIDIPPDMFWGEAEKLVILVLLPIVTFCGNLGNLAFLFTMFRVPRMQTAANLYLAFLAASDILFLSYTMLAYGMSYFRSQHLRSHMHRNSPQCWTGYTLSFVCYYLSLEVITLLSLERYYAICYPLKHRLFTGKSRTIKQLTISTLVAFLLGGVTSIKYGDSHVITFCAKRLYSHQEIEPSLQILYSCNLRNGRAVVSLISESIATLLFIAAFVSSCFMYVKVLRILSERSRSDLGTNQTNTDKVHKQVSQMLIANGIIFFVCQIPYRVYGIHEILADTLEVWSLDKQQRFQLMIIARIFLYVNSAINPYIYVAGSGFYQDAFLEAFGINAKHKSVINKAKSEKSISLAVV